MVSIYHQIIMILGEYILLGGFKLGEEVLDFFGVEEKFVEFRSDEDFILYDRHEFRVDIVTKNVKFHYLGCLGGWGKYLSPPLRYIC